MGHAQFLKNDEVCFVRAILQRVGYCKLFIDQQLHSEIGKGLLLLVGFEESDLKTDLEWIAKKVLNMRIFPDADDKMNLSLLDIKAELMIVSQFTLHASVKKGNRPSFIKAAKPDKAIPLYHSFIALCADQVHCASGQFGANMQIEFINDGPVTISLDSKSKDN